MEIETQEVDENHKKISDCLHPMPIPWFELLIILLINFFEFLLL